MMKPKVLHTIADDSFQSGAFRNSLYKNREIEKHGYRSIPVLTEEDQDSPRRVLYVTTSASLQSGATLCLVKMARNLNPCLFKTYVILPPFPGSASGFEIGGACSRSLFLNSLRRPHLSHHPVEYTSYIGDFCKSVSFLRKFIRQEKIDIVHVNEILDLPGMLAAQLEGLPLVTHLRAGIWIDWIRKLLAIITDRLSSRIVSVSEACARNFFDNKLPPNLSVVYDPAPDPQVWGAQFTEEHFFALRQELGIPVCDRIILVVAKLHPMKGHEFVIRAMPAVINEHPNVTLLLVGGSLERYSNEPSRLHNIASLLNLERKVVFAGFRKDVAALMRLADVVVFPSLHNDPFPGVVLEAMAVGRPLVASKVGGVPEQMTDEKSGLFAEPGNPFDIARQINRILGDPILASGLGEESKREVCKFSVERHISEIQAVYESL